MSGFVHRSGVCLVAYCWWFESAPLQPPYLFAEYMIFVFADPAQTMDVHHKTQEERSIVGADIEILPDIRLSAVRRRIRREVNIEFEEEESV